jgi:PhoPQ-activated pathogenicity-related protein
MSVVRRLVAVAALAVGVIWVRAGDPDRPAAGVDQSVVERSALDRMIAAEDPAFAWSHAGTADEAGVTVHTLRLTSQAWRDKGEVSHPEWTHWVRVAVPRVRASDTALLVITGGRRRDLPSQGNADVAVMLARQAGTVVAIVDNIPNQPLELLGDGAERREDDLIAESWVIARRTDDPTWVLQHAMVKSAVAAMDAVEGFLASGAGGGLEVDGFVVTGASKRGWTTWLTAAVDDRVRGIIPMVIDTLNLPATVRHHWGAYGFFSRAIKDYTERGLFRWIDDPAFRLVREQVDPYLYRDRLAMPKFLLNAAGDQYFLPDTTRFYAPELPGETRLRFVPNADHGIDSDPSSILSAIAFHQAVSRGVEIPGLEWSVEDEGGVTTLRVRPGAATTAVTLWTAHNAGARDFRVDTIGRSWTPTVLDDGGDGVFVAEIATPEAGFVAGFVEVVMPVDGVPLPLVFSTEVVVRPDVLPFADVPMGKPADGAD